MNTPNELRVAALQNSPAFNALYSAAPDSLTFKGGTMFRASARNVEEQLYYLSALAMVNPKALHDLARTPMGPYSLDADDSGVIAAKRVLKDCEAKLRQLSIKRTNQLALIQHSIDAGNACGSGDGMAAAVFTMGISLAACKAEHHVALGQRKGILVQIDIDIASQTQACKDAAADVIEEQKKLDDANRKLREQEERDRATKAREDLAAAQRRGEEQEARAEEARLKAQEKAAAARAKQAEQEAAARSKQATDDASSYVPDDFSGEEEVSYEDPDDSYWADAVESGIYGDADQTADQLHAQGECEPRHSDSPYYFDRYYACDACKDFDAGAESEAQLFDGDGYGCDGDGTCPTCAGYGLEGYGAEGDGVLAIFAGVLAIAPSVINAFSAPSGGAGGNKTKEMTDQILRDTGVQDKIDAAAAKEGDKIKTAVVIGFVALGALVVKLLA